MVKKSKRQTEVERSVGGLRSAVEGYSLLVGTRYIYHDVTVNAVFVCGMLYVYLVFVRRICVWYLYLVFGCGICIWSVVCGTSITMPLSINMLFVCDICMLYLYVVF